MRAATPLTEILEKAWDRQLFATGRRPGLATQLGWHSHWTFNSRGSAHGFPDRTVARERVIFVELKRELTGKASEDRIRQPSEQQRVWLDRLAQAGAEVYLWRPSDLDEIAAILSKRWMFYSPAHYEGPYVGLGADAVADWKPRSLWIPGVGRADAHDNEQQTLLTKGAA